MTHYLIWIISALAIAGVIIRPFKIMEAIWAVAGAVLILLFGLITPAAGWAGVAKGTDVYLFLTGMMLLAETAREHGLFDYFAARATRAADGSGIKLFALIYLVGVVVTIFLSNDATAVVLTPAVAAAVKAAKVEKPLPYLLICAFVANAASFVLPISNPANLVIYGSHMPALLHWLSLYLLPSFVAVLSTYLLLFFLQRKHLHKRIESDIEVPQLSKGGRLALGGIVFTAVVLLSASFLKWDLGLPTAITGILTMLIVVLSTHSSPLPLIKKVSWSVLPLVAGLFVIVEALNSTGLTRLLSNVLQHQVSQSADGAVWLSGLGVAYICNLVNNLPAGLIAGNVVQVSHISESVRSAILTGIDLGPNLSVTGSLATILWLIALRREAQSCTAWQFFKLGIVIMSGALLLTLASLILVHPHS
ncbi:arsenic transporter [Mucilaginibacter koreensis]